LTFHDELLSDSNFGKQQRAGGGDFLRGALARVLPRLLQVDALAGTIERDLAFGAAAGSADAGVNGGAEAVFFAGVTGGAGDRRLSQECVLDQRDMEARR